jgi:hypothetical protein
VVVPGNRGVGGCTRNWESGLVLLGHKRTF